jgi:hypothetical protein
MTNRSILAALAAVVLAVPVAAEAADICVECSEPAANYRCAFSEDDVAQLGLPARAAQVVCMTELARSGGHRFCRVVQAPLGGICSGQPRIVRLSRGHFETNRPPPDGNAQGPEPEKAPPATLADLAKDTAKSSGQSLKNAGTAIKDGAATIGHSVGSAFDCVASLFKRC